MFIVWVVDEHKVSPTCSSPLATCYSERTTPTNCKLRLEPTDCTGELERKYLSFQCCTEGIAYFDSEVLKFLALQSRLVLK